MPDGRYPALYGIRPSTGGVGTYFDNAVTESFFATLECELIDRSAFATRDQARSAVFDFIEGFYNVHRRHSFCGQLSLAKYARRTTQPTSCAAA